MTSEKEREFDAAAAHAETDASDAANDGGKGTASPAATGAIPRGKDVFGTVWLVLCCVFMLTMLASGFNFFPLVGLVLSLVASVAFVVRTAKDRPAGLYLWVSFLVIYGGTFLYFLIWGADSFGKRLWWNLVLIAGPVLLAVAFVFLRKVFKGKALKAAAFVTLALMIATTGIYALFMNLRARPVVDRMWEGHDSYLSSVASAKRGASPNVLIVLMDDMAYADISAYSYLTGKTPTINTPNIDSIAENGVIMENFYAASPVCSPSRFSMLTGRYSSRGYLDNVVFPTTVESTPWSPTHFLNPYQFLYNVDGILGDEITFAEVLQAAGYDTACIGKWNLGDYGEYLPTEQGFDYFYGSYYVNDMTPYNWVRDTGGGYPGGASHEEVRSHAENLDQSESTRLFTDEVLGFLSSSAESGNPFCAFYTSPWPHYPIYSDNNGNGKGDNSDDSYIDCIEEFDRELGRILDYLRATPDARNGGTLYDNTIVIFTSDNGPGREGAAGALRGRKNTTFEGGMKVPCIASYPAGGVGGNANSSVTVTKTDGTSRTSPTLRVTSSSMNFDVFTTVLSLCGIKNDDGSVYLPSDRITDGADLSALWKGETDPDASVHEALFYQKKGKAQAVQLVKVPVETENGTEYYDFKYFDRVQTENSAFIDQYYNNYLFNLDTDPIEGYNVSMVYPEVADKLAAALEAFRREMKTNRRGII